MTNNTGSPSHSSPQRDVEKDLEDGKSEDIESGSFPSRNIDDPGQSRVETLQRIVTGRSTSSYIDPGPPPDGGIEAWTVALMSRTRPFQIHLNILTVL
jgi:hypothetical protein